MEMCRKSMKLLQGRNMKNSQIQNGCHIRFITLIFISIIINELCDSPVFLISNLWLIVENRVVGNHILLYIAQKLIYKCQQEKNF